MNKLEKRWLQLPSFLKRKSLETLKPLTPEDSDFLIEQATTLAGQLRGSINPKAHELNKELILSTLMGLAELLYNKGYDDGQKSKIEI